jgi:aryl-alcohol dehydrogenase/geraniol dehydrogenase (NAD+)
MAAAAAGAKRILVVEPNPERRKLASTLGATAVIDPREPIDVVAAIKDASGGGVNHSLDCTGIPAVIGQAINVTTPGGTVGLIGIPSPEAAIPATLLDLLIKGVNLRPITEGDADPQTFIPKMIDLHRQGRFPFDRLIQKFHFDEINEAMHAAETGKVIKPVLVF